MTTAIPISLEYLAQMLSDPYSQIQERFYRQHPKVQALFFLDTDDIMRGAMLQNNGVALGSRRILLAVKKISA